MCANWAAISAPLNLRDVLMGLSGQGLARVPTLRHVGGAAQRCDSTAALLGFDAKTRKGRHWPAKSLKSQAVTGRPQPRTFSVSRFGILASECRKLTATGRPRATALLVGPL